MFENQQTYLFKLTLEKYLDGPGKVIKVLVNNLEKSCWTNLSRQKALRQVLRKNQRDSATTQSKKLSEKFWEMCFLGGFLVILVGRKHRDNSIWKQVLKNQTATIKTLQFSSNSAS